MMNNFYSESLILISIVQNEKIIKTRNMSKIEYDLTVDNR
jgi:hypothetical protein